MPAATSSSVMRCSDGAGTWSEWRAVPHPDGDGWRAEFRSGTGDPSASADGWEHLQNPSLHSCTSEAWVHCYRQIIRDGWDTDKVEVIGDDVPAMIEHQGNAVLMEFDTLIFTQHEAKLWSARRPGEDTGERWWIRRREWGGNFLINDKAELVKGPSAVHYICTYKPDRTSLEQISLAYEGKQARGGRHPNTLEEALGRCLQHAQETAPHGKESTSAAMG